MDANEENWSIYRMPDWVIRPNSNEMCIESHDIRHLTLVSVFAIALSITGTITEC